MLKAYGWKRFISIALSLVVVFSLAACGGSNSEGSGEAPNADRLKDQKELNILFPASSFTESIQPLVKEFEEKEGVKVNLELIGIQNYFDKVMVELSTGSDAYDLFYVFGEKISQYVDGGWLNPLDELIADKTLTDDQLLDKDDFMERAVTSGTFDGQLYGIPVLASTTLLYYRTDLFEQAGLTSPPNTWDELAEYAKKLHKDGIAGVAMRGSRAQTESTWTFSMPMYAFGGGYVKDFPEDMTPIVDSPEVAQAADYYADLLRNYSIKGATTSKYSDIIVSVQQGDVAMWIDGAPLVKQYDDPEKSKSSGKIGYAIVPEGPSGRFAALNTHFLSMNQKSENKELAWKFMQWATSKEMFVKLAVDGWHVAGTRESVYSDPRFLEKNNYGDGEWAAKYVETLDKYARDPYYPLNPEWPEVSDKVSEALSNVLSGQQSSVDAFKKANEEIAKIYKNAGYLE
ncbi:sugar ABC transporter substrate-binding protein [Cohnella hongkongensis]|uniref:Extracellular solute-binding protein n=1 Tax=Cohnella hongkongensis TaxID=178337 RepID=A0ABV9FIH6_9BACL